MSAELSINGIKIIVNGSTVTIISDEAVTVNTIVNKPQPQQPRRQPVVQPVVKPVSQPVVKPVSQPVVKPVSQQVAMPSKKCRQPSAGIIKQPLVVGNCKVVKMDDGVYASVHGNQIINIAKCTVDNGGGYAFADEGNIYVAANDNFAWKLDTTTKRWVGSGLPDNIYVGHPIELIVQVEVSEGNYKDLIYDKSGIGYACYC